VADKNSYSLNDLGLFDLFAILWKGKWIIIPVTFVFAVFSVVYALSIPNEYTARSTLLPSEEARGGGLASMARQFGGLASIAGVNLGQQDSTDKVLLAREMVRSRDFTRHFIQKYDILVPLMAAEKWIWESNRLVIDDTLYDTETNTWIRDVEPPLTPEPSMWEAHKEFQKRVSFNQDEMTSVVTVAVTHYSPHIAKQWAEWIIFELNERIRQADIEESQQKLTYLQEKLEETNIAEMRTVFSQLIENELQNSLLANVRQEYVLSVIDPAVIPEEKSGPNRPLICFLITFLGGFLASVFVIVRALLPRRQ